MNKLWRLALLLCFAVVAHAQTTNVTASIVDPSGTAWANLTWTATVISSLNPPVTLPGYNSFTTQYSGTGNSSGAFSVTVQQVVHIYPANATWQFCVVSGVSFTQKFCTNIPIGNSGQSSEDISSQINAIITNPVVAGGTSARAYSDAEVQALPGAMYFNVVSNSFRCYSSSWTNCGGGGGGGSPAGPSFALQFANNGATAFQADANFLVNPVTHTLTSTGGNLLVGAMSSVPRAVYDPMDTKFCAAGGTICGLAAAIAAQGGTPAAPTQVLQAAIDYGECQVLMGQTVFTSISIPLPSSVTINVGQVLLWANTSFGGSQDGSVSNIPTLQHNDATKVMVTMHAAGDMITCSNSTTYNPIPGGASGDYIHDFGIAGMGPVSTTTDIGIELIGSSSVARNIIGQGQIFGGPAIFSTGVSNFLQNLGYPSGQIQGCKTYTSGTLPVSSASPGFCGSVLSGSLDAGADNIYATDGQAIVSGHPAGACYPSCAAIAVGNSGGYLINAFAQVSDIDFLFAGTSTRANNLRADWTSREAVRLTTGTTGGSKISQLVIDSPCTDITLKPAHDAGTPTGCSPIVDSSAGGDDEISEVTILNNGIFPLSYNQCSVEDTRTGFSGNSDTFSQVHYQGNPNNTTSNDWAYCGSFDNTQIAGRVLFPTMTPMTATGTTINASGITSVLVNGQSVTNIVAGIGGQHLLITGTGIMKQGSYGTANTLLNLSGMDNIISTVPLEYVNVGTLANNFWQQIVGPPNQTPTHVNYAGNATPSNPSLLDVYGNAQSRQVPAITLSVNQLHGTPAGSGQACFEIQQLFADGSSVVSPLACTTVDLSHQTPGEIFAGGIPQATPWLYLVTNTEGNGVATGKYPPAAVGSGFLYWDGPTTIAAGGDGTTPPPASDNSTGESWSQGSRPLCPNPLPACTAEYHSVLCSVPGSGATADVLQMCSWNGSAFAWVSH